MKRVELYNDHFQNFKVYGIPHAQLIIADPPYNLGKNAYASNPAWYKDGDNKNGESELAGKEFFDTDKDFRPAEFMHFCSQMLVKEPKQGISDAELENGGGYYHRRRKNAANATKEQSTVHDYLLRLRTTAILHRIGATVRVHALYPACVPQELFGASAESEHEDCRQLRIRFGSVQGQTPKIQQRRSHDFQLFRLGA